MYCHAKCFVTKIVEHIQHNSNKTNTCHYPIRPSHFLCASIDVKVIIFDVIAAKKFLPKEKSCEIQMQGKLGNNIRKCVTNFASSKKCISPLHYIK